MQDTKELLRFQIQLVALSGTMEPNITNTGLRATLDAIHNALIRSSKQQVEWFNEHYKETTDDWHRGMEVIIDAVRSRLQKYDRSTFVVTKTTPGSIILSGFVGAIALWLLKKTFAEAFEEAWRKSNTRKKLVEWFRENIDAIADNTTKSIKQELARAHRKNLISGYSVSSPEVRRMIVVNVVSTNELIPPSYQEMIEKDEES